MRMIYGFQQEAIHSFEHQMFSWHWGKKRWWNKLKRKQYYVYDKMQLILTKHFFYEKSRLLFNWFISKFGKIQPKSWRDHDKSIKSDRIATTVRGGMVQPAQSWLMRSSTRRWAWNRTEEEEEGEQFCWQCWATISTLQFIGTSRSARSSHWEQTFDDHSLIEIWSNQTTFVKKRF